MAIPLFQKAGSSTGKNYPNAELFDNPAGAGLL
jgi:hypothetical protein